MKLVVNISDGDKYDVWAARWGKGGTKHLLNTKPGQKGWLGNPFVMKSEKDRASVIAQYKEAFLDKVERDPEFREAVLKLEGKVLGCFCAPKDCHCDIIVEWLYKNRPDQNLFSIDELA